LKDRSTELRFTKIKVSLALSYIGLPGRKLLTTLLFYNETEFVPSSVIAAGQKNTRAAKYKGRKGAQEERKVRMEEIEDGRVEDPLEKRRVFA
jgi:hypothetical protein